MFALSLIPITLHYVMRNGVSGVKSAAIELWKLRPGSAAPLKTVDDESEEDAVAGERLLSSNHDVDNDLEDVPIKNLPTENKLSLRETARLSLEFCMLWFLANYFASACLEYTSVGSVTILTSTSSVWTLVFCAVMGVEGFTIRKLIGVLASMAGVILISSVDLSGSSDENRGNFPHKTQAQIAIGDAMAFVSAIIYGVYVTVMKRKVGNEDRVNMPLFFGLVGLFNVLLLWPGFFILHFTGVETVSCYCSAYQSYPLTKLRSLRCLRRAKSGE
jgi:solute carrier family 35, member F5